MKNNIGQGILLVLGTVLVLFTIKGVNVASEYIDKKTYTPPTFINKALTDVKYTGDIDDGQAVYAPLIRITKKEIGSCTAFVISNEYALTAAHCLYDADGELRSGNYEVYSVSNQHTGSALAAAVEYRRDFGIIRGDFKKYVKARVRFEGSLLEGFSGKFVGCGFIAGSIKATCEVFQLTNFNSFMLQGQMAVFPGMSGGPVIDTQTGEVIAVITAGAESSSNALVTPLVGFDAALGIQKQEL